MRADRLLTNSAGRVVVAGRSIPRAITVTVLLAIAVAGISYGQWQIVDPETGRDGLVMAAYGVGLAAAVAVAWPSLPFVAGRPDTSATSPATEIQPPIWLVAIAAFTVGVTMLRAWYRGALEPAGDIIAIWLLSVVLLLVVALWPIAPIQSSLLGAGLAGVRGMTLTWRMLIPAGAIIVVALVARLIALDRFPTVLDSDEGFFMLAARTARSGDMPNPFITGFFSTPHFYLAVEGWIARFTGDTFADYRILSALCGAFGVIATWRLGHRLLGEMPGLLGAAVLALFPLHLWASRSALNNVLDTLALSTAMLFLDRALDSRRRIDAVVCGMAMGFGLYGYYGARIFPPVIAAIAVVASIKRGERFAFARFIRLGLWILAGFITAASPLLIHYVKYPDIFMSRIETVTRFDGDGSERGSVTVLLDFAAQIRDALLFPIWHDGTHGFFRWGPPFAGWMLAPLIAIGLATWIAWTLARWFGKSTPQRPEPLLIAWMIVSAGVAQTETLASQRFLALTFVWALAAGTGLIVIGSIVRAIVERSAKLLGPALAVSVTCIGLANAAAYYDEDLQLTGYSDRRTIAAYDLGWRLQQLEPTPPILLAGTPYLSYGGFGNFQFLVPNLDVTEIPPLEESPAAPWLASGRLLILAGERGEEERCAIERVNPNALVAEARGPDGILLYVAFSTGDGMILPTGETPAETTLVPVTDSPCEESTNV